MLGALRRHRLEVSLLLLFVLLAPVLARVTVPGASSLLRALGLTPLVDSLSGAGAFTDVGWEVASSRGLIEPGYSMYDPIDTLAPLIGMGAYDVGAHTHPPTSVVMWIPLGYLPYAWWLAFYVCAAAAMLAVSMRLVGAPAWVAYPVVAIVSLTPVGMFALTTTYPLMALVVALAWRYRDRPWIAGPAYAVLAASRGVAGVLLVYPLVRRQWRTLAIGLGIVVVLGAAAAVLEPSSLSGFVREGRLALESVSLRQDLFAPTALLERHGWPIWPVLAAAAAVVGIGLARHRELFWLLFWFSLAVSPLAWAHTIAGAVPLLVLMWRSGRLGQILTVVVGVAAVGLFVSAPVTSNVAWLVMLVATGVAVVACPIGQDSATAPHRGQAAAAEADPSRNRG